MPSGFTGLLDEINAQRTSGAAPSWLEDAPEKPAVPSWLDEDAFAPPPEPAPSTDNAHIAELDWSSDFGVSDAPQAASVPDWMSEIAPSTAEPATSFSNANDTTSAESDWLNDFSTNDTPSPVSDALQAASVPDWMSELAPSAEPATSFSNANDTTSARSDWLSDFSTDAPQAAADSAPQAANVPDWMSELAPSAEPATSFSNANDTDQRRVRLAQRFQHGRTASRR